MKNWSPEQQKLRRDKLFVLIRDSFRPLLNPDCTSERLIKWNISREVLRNAIPYLDGDSEDVEFGNRILRHLKDDVDLESGFSSFECSTMPGMIIHYRDVIEADLFDFLVDLYRKSLEENGMGRDFQFHGYNDNMPVMWSWAFTFGGEFFDDPRFTEVGWANLCQLRDLFYRRGAVSEFGAGYCSHRITSFANIVEYSSNQQFRDLAIDLEKRVWAELAGLWHPRLKQLIGPSMRGDMPAGSVFSYENYALFYQVFGDDILTPGLDWKRYITDTSEFVRECGGDPEKHVFASKFGYAAEFADATYHPGDDIAELLLNKSSGFTFSYTTECGHYNSGIYCKQIPVTDPHAGSVNRVKLTSDVVHIPHYPFTSAREYGITTFQSANFAVGSSTATFLPSSDAFRCHYRKREYVASPADFGSVHARYNINDKKIGYAPENVYWKTADISEKRKNRATLYSECGKTRCIQHENIVMCLQTPQPYEYWRIKSMRCDLVFANPENMTIHCGNQTVEALPFRSENEEFIIIEDGDARIGVVPLICRHLERSEAITISLEEKLLVVSLYNVNAEEREMNEQDMCKLGNGFVFIIEEKSSSSFEQFRDKVASVKVLDQLYTGIRRTHCFIDDVRLSSHLCPYSDTFMHTSVNGMNHDIPKFDINGSSYQDLPFMDKPAHDLSEDYLWLKTQFERKLPWYHPEE